MARSTKSTQLSLAGRFAPSVGGAELIPDRDWVVKGGVC